MKKRILIAPLNWGLGHASRCIPIIDYYISKNYEVFIGSNGAALSFLKKEFPDSNFLEYPNLEINYKSIFGLKASIFIQLPKLIGYISKEKSRTEAIVKEYNIDAIISDNRYGVYSEGIPSAIITHQLNFNLGIISDQINKQIEKLILKFDYCWLPDYPNRKLSGELSLNNSEEINVSFLGSLSRYNEVNLKRNSSRDFLVILSGPEPSRTIFENKIIDLLQRNDYSYLIVRGVESEESLDINKDNYVNVLNSNQLLDEIANSSYVVSRSGYSSIMDLMALNQKAILIPTKGQIEQEYLAQLHHKKNRFISMNEDTINLDLALKYLDNIETTLSCDSKIDYSILENFI